MESLYEKITFLNQATLECLSEPSEAGIIKKLTEAGIKNTSADFGFAWIRSKNPGTFELLYKSPSTPYSPLPPREIGSSNTVMAKSKPLLISDYTSSGYFRADSEPYVKSLVVIPIFFNNDTYGAIFLCFSQPKNFTEEDESLCVFIGNSAAQAITIHKLIEREHEARKYAEEQQERFKSLIENSYDAIGLVSPVGEITYASASISKFSGYLPEDLVGANMENFIHGEDFPLVVQNMQKILEQGGSSRAIEFRYRHKDSSWRWMESSWLNMLDNPTIRSIVVNVRDITDRKQAENTIIEQAMHDSLTGLPNRQEFAVRFSQALAQAKRHNRQMALMFLDMDRFKNVNDRLGHSAGDTLLTVMASRFASSMRGEDVASRYGGDEFLILVNEVRSGKDIVAAAEKILKAANLPVQIGAHTIHPSVSIGIAMYPHDGLDLENLKKNADIALYRAKENGRNRFSLYDSSLNGLHQAEKFNQENELRQALLLEQIVVYYQPIISLKKHKLVAVEALARWQHPTKGLLLPNEFIPLAEETGLICELDKTVLKQACLQAKLWQNMGLQKFRIAANLSAQQFSEPEFVGMVAGALTETGLGANSLELEITESLAMGNLELTSSNLKSLKKLGVHITIDDFGTGYSSLNYLKRFPIHRLKIDKSFIKHCITNPSDTSITKTIVAMAKILGLKVVAEGVEDIYQLDFLKSLGCDSAQGFFIAKPMPAQDLPLWLEAAYPKRGSPLNLITETNALVKSF